MKKILFSKKIVLLLAPLLALISLDTHAQYKWSVYTGDPTFKALEDGIDKGRIIYHKDAENNLTISGNRGVMFQSSLFAFPSLTGSFAWSQVRVNIGKIAFYPHIYTFDKGTSALSVAILYNISRVSPVRGIRTRPSFSPTSLLQLEKEKMNFIKLKFVSEGFNTDLALQTANQETELSLSDYDINYNYWLKSSPTAKEVVGLRTFFARPLKSFKLRAYSDKGYLDTTLDGSLLPTLGDVFVKTVDLYQRLIDPNYVNTNNKPDAKKKPAAKKRVKKKQPPKKKPVVKKKRVKRPPKAVNRKVVTTNKRPKTKRVVRPK